MSGPSAGARLIIVCGLPGAGKTTRARRLEERLGAIRLAPDDWMDALLERVRRRGREQPPIELADILRWSATFQTPTGDELALFDPPAVTGLTAEPHQPGP